MKIDKWIDKKGTSHGDWCRERFFEVTCKYCQQRVWYFECSHGCKVFFHKVPWRDDKWDAICPNYSNEQNLSKDFNYDLSDSSVDNFNYDLSDSSVDNFNYDLSEKTQDSFKYDLG